MYYQSLLSHDDNLADLLLPILVDGLSSQYVVKCIFPSYCLSVSGQFFAPWCISYVVLTILVSPHFGHKVSKIGN